MKRFAKLSLIIAGLLAVCIAFGSASEVNAQLDPLSQGAWSAPFNINVVGIHSTVLQNGKVLLWQYVNGLSPGSAASLWDSATGALTDVSLPYKRDVFCAGEIHLPNGRVMAIGGQDHNASGNVGVRFTDFFDPATLRWSRGPLMQFKRWYPTAMELPDGSIMVFGGQVNDTSPTIQVEQYASSTNAFRTLTPRANRFVSLFPRMFVLPNGSIFRAGDDVDTEIFDPVSATWTFVGNFNIGPRFSGAAELLPGLTRVLAIGGAPDGVNATNTVEMIDFGSRNPRWRYTASMHYPRAEPNAVLLPDSTVLVVGGGRKDPYTDPLKQAELFDPESQTWTVMTAQRAPRMYHSTAVLLPDGRVLSAGSDAPTSEFQTTAELYSPPYLFKGPRPIITSAPGTVSYAMPFSVLTPNANRIHRVALIKLAATTHAVNFDRRYVALTFGVGPRKLLVNGPAAANLAPPGWYMLYVVDSSGVPSIARMVQVRASSLTSQTDDGRVALQQHSHVDDH
ncbi:MAG: DUF1929 domain-containing protein [Candidatus Eremiobacteraeota bacterium]|nr:DUF1929 domain-containing protein [Candidatus Eremiobacteraeota bacterium]